MENNKYFTPNIEDIHIGYECEEHTPYSKDEWTKVIIEDFGPEADFDLQRCRDFIFMDKIRVPYLTKEQIEDEGWKHSEKNCFDFNDRWMCSWYPEHNRIEFYDNENENGFAGECKDINTFRKIIKLLGI